MSTFGHNNVHPLESKGKPTGENYLLLSLLREEGSRESEEFHAQVFGKYCCQPLGKPTGVWCNPPYGKDQPKGRKAPNWLEKALSCYENGEIEAAILLLNRTGAAWYKQQRRRVTAICEVHRRIPFIDATGKQQSSPRHYNDLLYLGKEVEKFKSIFEIVGEVCALA